MTDKQKESENPDECEQIDLFVLDVGEKLRCWCGKCKDFRQHRVKGINPLPKPPQTVCLTCSAVHLARLYRPGTRKKKSTKKPPAPVVNPWVEMFKDFDDETTDYTISGTYSRNEIVDHKAFGLGKVTEIMTKNKVRIIFEGGVKLMLQNHGS